MGAKITITRRSDDKIYINIIDDSSGCMVVEVSMPLAEFTLAITGLAHSHGEINRLISSTNIGKIGRKKIVESWYCEKVSLDKEKQKSYILGDYMLKNDGDWEMLDDGTRTQQPGSQHRYIVCKYVIDTESQSEEPITGCGVK